MAAPRLNLLQGVAALSLVFAGAQARAGEPILSAIDLQPLTPDQSAPYPLKVELTPILGKASSPSPGWISYLVTTYNPSNQPLGGRLRISPSVLDAKDERTSLIESELRIPAGGTARLELPVHGAEGRSVKVTIVGPRGETLGVAEGSSGYDFQPLLFDLDEQGNIGALLRHAPLPGAVVPGATPTPLVQASSVIVDQATGEKLAPEHSFGYSGATLVLADIESVQALREGQRRALIGWVLAGGSLAFSVTKTEALRTASVKQLVGSVAELGPHEQLVMIPNSSHADLPDPEEAPEAHTLPGVSVEQLAALQGFRGGNLRPSPWGSSASYGLGEVHLLSFTPNSGLFRGSEFARSRVLTLLAHAWQRRAQVSNPLGHTPPNAYRNDAARSELSTNSGNHRGIVGATLVLLLYALLAGPVSFKMAAAAGKPLRSLFRLPIWSLATMGAVLLIGVLSRGGQRKAKHLTFLEGGAGMSVATSMSFRAFNAESLDKLKIAGRTTEHVVGLSGQSEGITGQLVADGDGLHLSGIHAKPWKTVVVREDGFAAIGRGVSLRQVGSALHAKNGLGQDLAGVLIKTADGRLFGFDLLADGVDIDVQSGDEIPVVGAPPRAAKYPLLVGVFHDRLQRASSGLPAAWEVIAAISGDEVDWWPADVPVLLGQIVGGQGQLQDTQLTLETDRVLLRIVGYGGAL